jgi:hypothetical protein
MNIVRAILCSSNLLNAPAATYSSALPYLSCSDTARLDELFHHTARVNVVKQVGQERKYFQSTLTFNSYTSNLYSA